jgi:hypothetical protein
MKAFNSLLAGSVAITSVFAAGAAIAAEPTSVDQLSQYSREGQTAAAAQVTSVSQLSDVRPTDWAFQALQSLVERYGCIAGYPDKTYRGNRAMTRYEFAAGLNACMDRVNELIAAATNDLAKKEDLAVLQKLQEEFAAELATLRGRVDALEAKTATLEKQQFSTTTKLEGEAIFAVTDEFGTNNDNNTVLQNRVRLQLNTSFTGKDKLITRLAMGNGASSSNIAPSLGNEAFQVFNAGNPGGNTVNLDWLAYYGGLNEKVNFYVAAVNGVHNDYAPTANAMDSGDSGNTTLSVFGQRNPIYWIGGGAGAGVTVDVASGLKVSGGYLAATAATPANNLFSGNGLFNGDNSILGQISYAPEKSPFQLALTYVNALKTSDGLFDAGARAINPVSIGTSQANSLGSSVNSAKVNAYGASATFNAGKLLVNGFVTYANVNPYGLGATRDVWTYGGSVGVKDFGKEGNLLGVVVGAQPYSRQVGAGSVPLHVEGFYKYQLNDRVSVTPGVIWVNNPGQQSTNSDVWVGTLRTTFSF